MTAIRNDTIEHPIGREGILVLRLRHGDVHLQGTEDDTVRITGEDGTAIDDAFTVERGEGSLTLGTTKGLRIRGGGSRSTEPSMSVQVPARATVVIEAGSADLSAADLAGDQRYQTVSGDVTLSRVRGSVAIDAVSGDIKLSASGTLRLRARTVSGDLSARAGRLAGVELATTSGDVSLAGELEPEGTHRIETVSGDTLLAIAGGARVVVSSVTGDVRADVPHRSEGGRGRRVLILGDGQATLAASSMSGDVRIVKPRPFEELDGTRSDAPTGSASPFVDRPSPAALAAPAPGAPPPPAEPRPRHASATDVSDTAIAAAYDDARLSILRGLERGEYDVAEAGRRLEALDAADVHGDRSND